MCEQELLRRAPRFSVAALATVSDHTCGQTRVVTVRSNGGCARTLGWAGTASPAQTAILKPLMARRAPWVGYDALPETVRSSLQAMREAHAAGRSTPIEDQHEAYRFENGHMWFPRATVHGPSLFDVLGRALGFLLLPALLATILGFANGHHQRWLFLAVFGGALGLAIISYTRQSRVEAKGRRGLGIGAFLLGDVFLAANGRRFRVVERKAVSRLGTLVRKSGSAPDTRHHRQPTFYFHGPDGELFCRSGFENNPAAEALLRRWLERDTGGPV